jgi:hypothetical protein
MDWSLKNKKEYYYSKEQQEYRRIRAMRLNNYGMGLRKIFEREGLFFKNYTATEFPCFEYKVLLARVDDLLDNDYKLLHKLGDERNDIEIFVSKLGNFYTYGCYKTKFMPNNDGEKGDLDFFRTKIPNEFKDVELKMRKYLYTKNLEYLSPIDVCDIIPDISTQYTEIGETTIFNLLFISLYRNPWGIYTKEIIPKSI